MTETAEDTTITGSLHITDDAGTEASLSEYAMTEIDSRNTMQLLRWLKLDRAAATVYNETGFESHETFEASLKNFLGIVRTDNKFVNGEIEIRHADDFDVIHYRIVNNEVFINEMRTL